MNKKDIKKSVICAAYWITIFAVIYAVGDMVIRAYIALFL